MLNRNAHILRADGQYKAEITSIAKRRSDFEHTLNARGSKSTDFARYVEWETNLENLRRRKAKRLGVKGDWYVGQRRTLHILERATRKFHGDIALWIQYLDCARRQKAFKKVSEILTNLARLHPTKPEVWIYAAAYAIEEHGDMTEGRSYMQRGLRFCKNSRQLWLEYAKLELLYIAKISARRKILGLDEPLQRQLTQVVLDDPNADMIALPAATADEVDPSTGEGTDVNPNTLQALSASPALSGAIPTAIFDAAMKEFGDSQYGGCFFELARSFENIPCLSNILEHITSKLIDLEPSSPVSLDCYIRQPLLAMKPSAPRFPRALGLALKRLKTSMEDHPSADLAQKTIAWNVSFLGMDLDPDIRKVLVAIVVRTLGQYECNFKQGNGGSREEFTSILDAIHSARLDEIVSFAIPWAIDMWPSDERLLKLKQVADDGVELVTQ